MLVQSIAMINCRKPHFTAAPRKELNYGFNSQVTLRDLYDSEDRIMEHQEKLIRKQSSQIARTLNMMTAYIVAPDTINSKNFGIELDKLGIADRYGKQGHSRGSRNKVVTI